MNYLLKNLKSYRLECILAPLFKMLEAMFDLLVPIVVAHMINTGIVNHDKAYIYRCCLILIAFAVVGLCCSFAAQYFAAKAATGCAAKIRHGLFSHVMELGFTEFDTIGTSTLITRMTSDINQVQNGINLFLRLFLRSPFIVIGAMIMAFTIDPTIAIIFVLTIPMLSLVIFAVMKVTSPLYKTVQGKLDTVTRLTRENLTGIRVVRAFGKEEYETSRFIDANEDLTRMQVLVGKMSAFMNPVTLVIVNIGIIAILVLGGSAVDTGVLLSGNIIALVNYMSQILVELVKLANLIVSVSRAKASLDRVVTVIETKPEMAYPELANAKQADKNADYEIVFDHVCEQYAGAGAESLTDISFEVKKGQTVGIIGGTGSGKSTLVSLIPRFYDRSKGNILIGGEPIENWSKEALRKYVGTVMQKAQLFSGTIRSNLQYGNQTASDEEMWDALKRAQGEEFVKTKSGQLDAVVEQGGRNFSGGQKQRLTIARALVGKPEILILDDSASALDFATDAALRKAIKEMEGQMTVFIVSQRTSSIQHADQILVLDDGNLVGKGTHEELLKSCSVYREIHESQFKKEEGGSAK